MTPEAICPISGETVIYLRRTTSEGKPVADEENGLWQCDCSLSGVCPEENNIWANKTPPSEKSLPLKG